MGSNLVATPVSDQLNGIIERLKVLGLPSDAETVDSVRRDCMAIERRSELERGKHLETVRALHQEIRDLKAAARRATDVDERAEKSANEILAIIKSGKNFAGLIYVEGVVRFDLRHSTMSVLRPVFNILKRRKCCRVKGHTLKCSGLTIYGRKVSA